MWISMMIGCGGGASDLAPSLTERGPAKSPLQEVQGRWEPVVLREEGPVRETGCAGPERFVEFRGDGEGGWEMVAAIGADLAILPVLRAETTNDGLSIELSASSPDQMGQTMTITWVESDRIGTFSAPLADFTAVTPAQRSTVPTTPCGD